MPSRWLGLLVALVVSQPVYPSPFISEIFFSDGSAAPGPALEISGIEGDGATVLVINASSNGGLVIRRKFELAGAGTVLLGESDVIDALVPTSLEPYTQTLPAFSLPLGNPVAVAVFAGTTGLQPGLDLAQPLLAEPELTANPVVDWITLTPTSGTELFEIDANLAASLGIDDLPRPTATTQDVSVLARAIVDGIPRLESLLPGTSEFGVSGISAGLNDFPVSPAVANPGTQPRTGDDPGDGLPEPGTAALALVLGLLTTTRCRRSRCLPHAPGL